VRPAEEVAATDLVALNRAVAGADFSRLAG
jgi:hypothetical protein